MKPTHPTPFVIALTGLLALAVAMGIGRFAFTPLLPMMLADEVVNLPTASWLATANYLGYLVGALGCTLQPALWRRLGWATLTPTHAIKLGLVATGVLTLGMALPPAAAWPLWRFLAGVASALVFVYTSGWCLARLATLGAPALGGLIFVGPGLGIAVSGLAATAMVAMGWRAATGWAVFAVLAVVLMAIAWPKLQPAPALPTAAAAPSNAAGKLLSPTEAWFVLAYGLAGFGYIVTATFLPVIARQALPGSIWLDLFWPLFGLGVSTGALLTLRVPTHWDRRHLLTACYAMQALGVGLSVWWPSRVGFALGSLLLGLPFTAITLFAMQEARRLRPAGASSFMGGLATAYALGQIAGPPMVAALLARADNATRGFTLSLQVAACALVAGGCMYAWLARQHPLEHQP